VILYGQRKRIPAKAVKEEGAISQGQEKDAAEVQVNFYTLPPMQWRGYAGGA